MLAYPFQNTGPGGGSVDVRYSITALNPITATAQDCNFNLFQQSVKSIELFEKIHKVATSTRNAIQGIAIM